MGVRKVAIAVMAYWLLTSGCAFFKYQPDERTEFRPHPLGMNIYNLSESPLTEDEWERISDSVLDAYNYMTICANGYERFFDALLKKPIVIIPSRDISILWTDVSGFTDLQSIFLRRDRSDISRIRHEWGHLLLFMSGEHVLGDIFHTDGIFQKCAIR